MIWNDNILKVKTVWNDLVHNDGTVNVVTTYTFPPNCLKEAWDFKTTNNLNASVHLRKDMFKDGSPITHIEVQADEWGKIENHPEYYNLESLNNEIAVGGEEE